MTTSLRIPQGAHDAALTLLRHWMKEGRIRGVFSLRRLGDSGAVNYELVTDAERIDELKPFHPQMPANAGRLLSKTTLHGAFEEPIAAVIRPCELRGFIELVKRQQGDMANILTICPTCPGVLPLDASIAEDGAARVDAYWESVARGELPSGIRPSCLACEHPIPMAADVIVRIVGEPEADAKTTFVFSNDEAAGWAEGIDGEVEQASEAVAEPEGIKALRDAEREKQRETYEASSLGLDGLIETFAHCTGCHGCSAVCPICYCQLCEFESSRSGFTPPRMDAELRRKGAAKVPPGTLAFQLGRLAHMAMSCVGCGMCSDVCPADIPVADAFRRVGRGVQALFDYVPGRSVDEAIPLTTFVEQELSDIGE